MANILHDALWGNAEAVICTSATLSNSGTFGYTKNRLGLEECNEIIPGSPFDFMNQSLLYVPDDLAFPSASVEYADAVADRIGEIITTPQRSSLHAPSTSYRMLREVFDRLVDTVPFRLLRQGEMSNERLIRSSARTKAPA